MMNFPNRGFYRGDLNAALKDYGVLLVPKEETIFARIQDGEVYESKVIEPPAIEETLLSDPVLLAKQKGYTGNPCTKCGSMSVVMTGHCETCQDCGETSSCG